MTTKTKPTGVERFEGIMLVLILLAIGGMSAAASFTHIHDWTMANSPEGTGDWFGWANAVVSDLVPLGVGLEVRRRRRHNLPIGWYPITIILAAAALSVAGQLAMATPSITGWLLAAVPALGFLALTKLVLSRPTAPAAPKPAVTEPAATPATQPAVSTMATPTTPAVSVPTPAATPAVAPVPAEAAPARATDTDSPEPAEVSAELIPGARIIADAYREGTGQPITREGLAERLRVPLHTAERLLDALAATEPHRTSQVPARVNGAPVLEATA